MIFPAFPDKGIVSYVKTKVAITKDVEYMRTRMKVVERFMNWALNHPTFQYDQSQDMRKFLSSDKEFELWKKTEKGSMPIS